MLISIAEYAFIEKEVFIDLDQYTASCRIVYIVDISMLITPIFFL